MAERVTSWHRVLWREWRNSDDPQCGEQLFDLVADGPATVPAAGAVAALGAAYGALCGVLVACLATATQAVPALGERHHFGLGPCVVWGALLGGALAPMTLLAVVGRLSWRVWLFWLFSASPLPAHVWVLRADRRDWPYRLRDCLRDSFRWAVMAFAAGLFLIFCLWTLAAGVALLASAFGLAPGGACCLLWMPLGVLYLLAKIDALSDAFEQITDSILAVWRDVRHMGFCWGAAVALGAALWLGLLGGYVLGKTAAGPIGLVVFLASCPAIGWRRAQQVVGGIAGFPSRTGCFWWQPRPPAALVEEALRRLATPAWSLPLSRTDELRRPDVPLRLLLAGLDSSDWVKRFAARHALAARGGEAVDPLVERAQSEGEVLRGEAVWLVESIALRTRQQLGPTPRLWLCKRCLVHCGNHQALLPRRPVTYYGCRSCKQSREVLPWSGPMVAVLDTDRAEGYWLQADTLCVNWLRRRTLFDFDRVAILRATDEQVEAFLMQLRQHGPAFDLPPLGKLRCSVAPGCTLSGNTRRNLQFLFGDLE